MQFRRSLVIRGLDGIGAYGTPFPLFLWQSISGQTMPLATLLTNSAQWSSLSAEWDEFQPRSIRIRGECENPYSLVGGPFFLTYDNDGVITTPTAATVVQYHTTKLLTTRDPFEVSYAFSPPADGTWYDFASPTDFKPSLTVIYNPLSALTSTAQTLSFIMWEMVVDFRGVR
jgi:hypothetical protein